MYEQLQYLRAALDKHPELKFSISQSSWQTDFFRFYRSQTNYNISKDNVNLAASLYKDKKSYSFGIDDPTEGKIDAALKAALAIIDKLPEDPDFVDVEDDLRMAAERQPVNNINAIPLQRKTDILSSLAASAEQHDFELYGTFICNYSSSRLMNSNNLDKVSSQSPIYLEIKAVHKKTQLTVMETFGGDEFGYFDLEDFRSRLMAKIEFCNNEVADVEAGTYDVILAPRCVAEFVQYLGYGMSARALDQHSSYFEGKIDQRVFPALINIVDDPNDPEMIRMDYGSEGHIYKPLKLIDKGYFRNFTCNQYYHYKTGLPKNGNTNSCLKIAPGTDSLETLISKVKKGLYISSLHYMNFINAKETSLTGLTRDGTFLIEDGKISKVIMNLRFTERIERILKNVIALENRAYTIPFSENYESFDIETVKAPHALVTGFNITSSTHTI
ncbi:MAG: metallopeptidase TldD-related protein [Candidatus Cloacimonetes bacterium]|nr:metallopeptidase TldD-related protein [Candidatus Cloacimonadota bacterium]